jgi:uncharacterized membrane protein
VTTMSAKNFDDTIFSATLRPHRSLHRAGFIVLVSAITAIWLGFGLFLWELGAWPVIGFGGLDVLAIYVAFKLSYRSARAFEEVEVSRTAIVVRKVMANGRAQEFRFNPQWVRLEVEEIADEGVVRIALKARDKRVPVGTFLNPEDRKSFARAFGAALAAARI